MGFRNEFTIHTDNKMQDFKVLQCQLALCHAESDNDNCNDVCYCLAAEHQWSLHVSFSASCQHGAILHHHYATTTKFLIKAKHSLIITIIIIIRIHHYMQYKMQPIFTTIAWNVCLLQW